MDVAVIHFQLGPYHLARGHALATRRSAAMIELASREHLRKWRVSERPEWAHTVCEGALEDLSPRLIANETVAWLERHGPAAVCIAGYAHRAMRAAADWARRRSVPVILLSDSQHADRPRWLLLEAAKRLWVKRHVSAAFVAGSLAASYVASLGVRSERIWRGYDVVDNDFVATRAQDARERASQLRDRLGLPPEFLLYVGRLAIEKDLDTLLHACRMIRPLDCALVLAGSGPQEAELRSTVRRLQLDGKVLFLGFRQLDQVCELYALARALVLPSMSEPWGLVVNEAMACGLPILASTRCGCVPELVFPGVNGYLFEAGSVEGLARGIERMALASSTELAAMGAASRRLVAQFTPETWAAALDDCLQNVGLKRAHP